MTDLNNVYERKRPKYIRCFLLFHVNMNLSRLSLSLSCPFPLSVRGSSTLKRLLHNYYEDTFITYKCP